MSVDIVHDARLCIERACEDRCLTSSQLGFCFLTPEEGGRLEPGREGIKPQLKLGGIFTSVVVHAPTGTSTFDSGGSYEVGLEIMFWD